MMAVDEAARLLFVSTRYVLRLLETSELLRVPDASGDVFDIDPTSLNIYMSRLETARRRYFSSQNESE
jgi:hypothetical protein